MRYWDSSALMPLALLEPESAALRRLHTEDGEVATWWATRVECMSALERRQRERKLDADTLYSARLRIQDLHARWLEVQPSDDVRELAERLLRTHAVGIAEALQLAAAVAVSEGKPTTLEFVTLDARLADAARREGFQLRPA